MLFKMLPHYAPHFTTKCAKFGYRVLAPTFSYNYCYYFNYLVTYYCSYYYNAAYYVAYYFYALYYSKYYVTPLLSPLGSSRCHLITNHIALITPDIHCRRLKCS